MTDRELKTLKDNLWHAADVLRSGAHLAANKYGQPILGLIFLRYADILFKQHKDEIDAEYTKRLGTRMKKTSKEIAVEKCGFFLPECAYYDFINDAPDTAEKADLVKKAMEAIERENPKMEGVLPKEVYAQLVPEEEPELLSNIVRIFKDSIENLVLACYDCNRSKSSLELSEEDLYKVDPDGPDICRSFFRDEDYYIRISEDFSPDDAVNQFYKQLGLDRQIHRLDYLLMNMRGLREKLKDKPLAYTHLTEAIEMLQQKRR